jgi:hypothetical protein
MCGQYTFHGKFDSWYCTTLGIIDIPSYSRGLSFPRIEFNCLFMFHTETYNYSCLNIVSFMNHYWSVSTNSEIYVSLVRDMKHKDVMKLVTANAYRC